MNELIDFIRCESKFKCKLNEIHCKCLFRLLSLDDGKRGNLGSSFEWKKFTKKNVHSYSYYIKNMKQANKAALQL